MAFDKDTVTEHARRDLADRLGVSFDEVTLVDISDAEFPDSALGAPATGEMAAQMISDGWRIELGADGKIHEYRADKYQLRLCNFDGRNYVIAQ
jgi:hypothetical protein